MAWYYNSDSGAINESPEWLAYPELHMGVGWHGPFKTKDEAIQFYKDGKPNNPGWKEPTGLLGNLGNTLGNTGRALGITDPLGNLNLSGWFVRIAEILLGLLLIGVGVAKLTGVSNQISKAAKVAAVV